MQMERAAILLLVFFTFSVVSCNRGSRSVKPAGEGNEQIAGKRDTSYLFDGETLNGWKITDFGTQGPVYISGDNIILGMGDGCTGITWEKEFPTIGYRVTLDAMRTEGHDFFCGMTFPAGKEPCTLIIGGWGGSTVGLSSINGMDASENETTVLRKFKDDTWYTICLVVKEDTIRASVNDTVVVNYVRKAGDVLSVRPEVELSRPFGIASWRTTAALRNIRVETIPE